MTEWMKNTPTPRSPPLETNNPTVTDRDPPDEINIEYDGIYWYNEISSQMWYCDMGVWKSYQTLSNIKRKKT